MELLFRICRLVRCSQLFFLCRPCFRGDAYCGADCRREARFLRRAYNQMSKLPCGPVSGGHPGGRLVDPRALDLIVPEGDKVI